MKAGGKQDGDFRELSGSLASAFRHSFICCLLSFVLLSFSCRGCVYLGSLCASRSSCLRRCTKDVSGMYIL